MKNATSVRTRSALGMLVPALALWAFGSASALGIQDPAEKAEPTKEQKSMQVQFLEIVTPEADETCAALEKMHKVEFSKPDPMLGNARTVALNGGGRISVRAPMHAGEEPTVRPYLLVEDIKAAIAVAEDAGGKFAMGATEIPGQGTFAIYFLGGIQHGLWQN